MLLTCKEKCFYKNVLYKPGERREFSPGETCEYFVKDKEYVEPDISAKYPEAKTFIELIKKEAESALDGTGHLSPEKLKDVKPPLPKKAKVKDEDVLK